MFKNLTNLSLITFLAISVSFSGCSDKKESKEEKTATKTLSPKIEIVTNNTKEIKVEVKDDKKSTSKNAKSFYYDYGEKSEYSQDAEPANKDADVRVRPRTVLDAYSHIRSPYERVQVSLIARQLSSTFRLKCSACHDDYANGVLGPSLLGKDASYIYDKIIEFKTGVKSNPLMSDLIKHMDNKEIKTIANEIYEFNKQVQKLRGR